jgi:hypothetical protein
VSAGGGGGGGSAFRAHKCALPITISISTEVSKKIKFWVSYVSCVRSVNFCFDQCPSNSATIEGNGHKRLI